MTFFRSIGASFGVAVFGAILNSRLSDNLARQLAGVALPPDVATGGAPPATIAALPAGLRDLVVDAYASTIETVFLVAVPIAAIAFLLAWWLPELKLKETTKVPAGRPGAAAPRRRCVRSRPRAWPTEKARPSC